MIVNIVEVIEKQKCKERLNYKLEKEKHKKNCKNEIANIVDIIRKKEREEQLSRKHFLEEKIKVDIEIGKKLEQQQKTLLSLKDSRKLVKIDIGQSEQPSYIDYPESSTKCTSCIECNGIVAKTPLEFICIDCGLVQSQIVEHSTEVLRNHSFDASYFVYTKTHHYKYLKSQKQSKNI